MNSHDFIYLASPYSHELAAIREHRFQAVSKVAALLMADNSNLIIFSPIAHSHTIAVVGGLDGSWEKWAEFDLRMINACDALLLLQISGWQSSKGMRAEVDYAVDKGKPIFATNFNHEGNLEPIRPFSRLEYVIDE